MSKKAGRPTKYTPELASSICKRIAEGESVRSICNDDDMPNASTVHAWVLDDIEGFSKQYARAKEIGAETEAEELEKIAREEEDVQRARLIVDTKKWVMSKKLPKKYGDKIDVTSDGKALPTPILNGLSTDNSNKADSESQ